MLRGHATLSASVSSEQGEVAAGSVEILMSQSSTLSLLVGAIYCRRQPLPSNPLKEILLSVVQISIFMRKNERVGLLAGI